jgi:hypothetical protein
LPQGDWCASCRASLVRLHLHTPSRHGQIRYKAFGLEDGRSRVPRHKLHHHWVTLISGVSVRQREARLGQHCGQSLPGLEIDQIRLYYYIALFSSATPTVQITRSFTFKGQRRTLLTPDGFKTIDTRDCESKRGPCRTVTRDLSLDRAGVD